MVYLLVLCLILIGSSSGKLNLTGYMNFEDPSLHRWLVKSVHYKATQPEGEKLLIMSDGFIAQINKLQTGWTAGRNFAEDTPIHRLQTMVGTKLVKYQDLPPDFIVPPTIKGRTRRDDDYDDDDDDDDDDNSSISPGSYSGSSTSDNSKPSPPDHNGSGGNSNGLPRSFNAQDKWSMCPSLREVRDQAHCGSCWAFAAAEAMTDRLCIHTRGGRRDHLAAQDILSCAMNDGCNGGYPKSAWDFWVKEGVVTGGPYNSRRGCLPYEITECSSASSCSSNVQTPACVHRCKGGESLSYKNDKTYGSSSYGIRGEKDMMTEIYHNGPIEGALTVYDDFTHYKTGVYRHVAGGERGGHAIKIIGWGVENGDKYWLIANSWTKYWGDGGFVKVLRGRNECGIENVAYAGIPKD